MKPLTFSKKNTALVFTFLTVTTLVIAFQNFVSPTSSSTLNTISQFDTRLASTIADIDSRYMTYAGGLRSCHSRTAEIELEHKKMKADLVRVASLSNPFLNSFGAEILNAPDSFPALQTIIDNPNRNHLHVVGIYEPMGRSTLPVRIQISGTGTTDLYLTSYESVNWLISDPNRLLKKVYVSSYHPSQVNGVASIIERVPFKSSIFSQFAAQGALDDLMRARLALGLPCDDFKLASFQGGYSGSVTTPYNVVVNSRTVITPPPPPPPLPTARLEISMDGGPLLMVGFYTKDAAYNYCKSEATNKPAVRYKCFWNGTMIFESNPVTPPPLPTGKLELSMDGGPLMVIGMFTKDAALNYCKSEATNKPAVRYKCFWNGTMIFESNPIIIPPPHPTGRLELSRDGGPLMVIGMFTKEAALNYCKSEATNKPEIRYKCFWNGTMIFENNPVTPPPLPTGKLELSRDGGPLMVIGMFTKEAALNYCKSEATNKPEIRYKCFWNGTMIFENNPIIIPPPHPTGRLELSRDGGPLMVIGMFTKEAALNYCKSEATNKPEIRYKCFWNGTMIFENNPIIIPPPPPPPTPTPPPAPATGRLEMSMNGGALTVIGIYTRDAAYDYCKSKSISNPTIRYRCLWNGAILFGG